jgi:hypothetical protein
VIVLINSLNGFKRSMIDFLVSNANLPICGNANLNLETLSSSSSHRAPL